MQGGLSAPPLSYLKAGHETSPERGAPLFQEEKNNLINRDWGLVLKWTCTNRPTEITPIFHVFPSPTVYTASSPSPSVLLQSRHFSFFVQKGMWAVGPKGFFTSLFSFQWLQCTHTYKNKFICFLAVDLWYVSLILRPVTEPEGRRSLFYPIFLSSYFLKSF